MSKPYAKMDEHERWLWHSEVYAFRRVVLGVHEDVVANPCDPGGRWIDEGLIGAAIKRLQGKRDAIDRRSEEAMILRRREGQRVGRDIVNKWARAKGYADLDAYCAATDQPWVDAYTQIVQEISLAAPNPQRIGRFRSLANLIGGDGRKSAQVSR